MNESSLEFNRIYSKEEINEIDKIFHNLIT